MSAVALLAGITAGLGIKTLSDVLGGIKRALIDETGEAGVRLAKLRLAEKFMHIRDMLAVTFDVIGEADPSLTAGIAPSGLLDVFMRLIDMTVVMSAAIGDEMADELLLELLQEGCSNAIQTSVGGAFQTIWNVYRGSMSVYGDDLTSIPQVMDFLDRRITYFNAASAGMNIFATLHYLLQGVVSNLTQAYSNLYNQLQQFATRLIEEDMYLHYLLLDMARQYLLADITAGADAVDNLIRFHFEVIDTALARLNDMLNQLRTLRRDVEAGVTDPDKAYAIAESIERMYQATKEEADKAYNEINEIIQGVTLTVSRDSLTKYQEALDKYRSVIEKMVDKVNMEFYGELSRMITEILDIIDAVLAYRFYTDRERDLDDLPEKKFFEAVVPSWYTLKITTVLCEEDVVEAVPTPTYTLTVESESTS